LEWSKVGLECAFEMLVHTASQSSTAIVRRGLPGELRAGEGAAESRGGSGMLLVQKELFLYNTWIQTEPWGMHKEAAFTSNLGAVVS
jgi:hypothetical protein